MERRNSIYLSIKTYWFLLFRYDARYIVRIIFWQYCINDALFYMNIKDQNLFLRHPFHDPDTTSLIQYGNAGDFHCPSSNHSPPAMSEIVDVTASRHTFHYIIVQVFATQLLFTYIQTVHTWEFLIEIWDPEYTPCPHRTKNKWKVGFPI